MLGDTGSASIILGNGAGYPPGVSFSSPLPNVQIGLLRFSFAQNEIHFLPSSAIMLLDLNFYVATELPGIRGTAMLPGGADLQIATAWDCVNIIGFSSWFVAVAALPARSPAHPPAPPAHPNPPGVPRPRP